MTALYVTYTLETGVGDRALAVHLRQPEGDETPPHEILRELHRAMAAWNEAHPDVFVRSDLGVEPGADALRRELSEYRYADGTVNAERLGRHLGMVLETGRIHIFSLRPGAPVEGRNLIGRREVLTELRQRLRSGSVHLKAPRRYGKTSLLRHLEQILSEEGEACLYVDVSPGVKASWFLVTLVQEAMEDPLCRPPLLSLPELADWPDANASPRQRSQAGRRLEKHLSSNVRSTGLRILEALGSVGAILLVDEFSVFLRQALEENPEETEMVSEILARARRAPEPVRQILAGSAGLSSFLHFYDLAGLFADLDGVPLGPLNRREAVVLAEELLYGARQTPSSEVVEEILSAVGVPIPYFLHALVNVACEKSDELGRLDVELIRQSYREGLLGSHGNGYFKDYKLVNQPYPPHLIKPAGGLLREIAGCSEGLPEERLRDLFAANGTDSGDFEPLLSCLEEDYDLVEVEGRWTMRSKVLRDRWSQREPWLTGEEP